MIRLSGVSGQKEITDTSLAWNDEVVATLSWCLLRSDRRISIRKVCIRRDTRGKSKVRFESGRHDAAVNQCDDSVGLVGDATVVRDHDYSEPLLAVQLT